MTTKYNELLLKAQRDIIITNSVMIGLLALQINKKSVSDSSNDIIEKTTRTCNEINDFLGLK